MATKTLGTASHTTLTALPYLPGYGSGMSAADIATIAEAILNDQINTNPIFPGAFSANGLLYVPNRGVLKILNGDFVGVDGTGWPVLVSKTAAASASWVHS